MEKTNVYISPKQGKSDIQTPETWQSRWIHLINILNQYIMVKNRTKHNVVATHNASIQKYNDK